MVMVPIHCCWHIDKVKANIDDHVAFVNSALHVAQAAQPRLQAGPVLADLQCSLQPASGSNELNRSTCRVQW
jgi:hypothetical protein